MNSVYRFDGFELDCRAFELRHGGSYVHVDVIGLRLLEALLRHAGQLAAKEDLIAEVWTGRVVSDNTLTVAIARLRKLFIAHGMPRESVRTVFGRGYRFTRPVTVTQEVAGPARTDGETSSAFVGRERVMLQLETALAAARYNNGRLVLLRGKAGLGKTQIAAMFAQRARYSGCIVAWSACREQGGTPPLWPFMEWLRIVLSAAGPVPLPTAAGKRYGAASTHELFDAIARALAEAAMTVPLLLILDDLQHADDLSLELLRYLVVEIAHTRILIVATLRDVPDRPLSAALTHRNCTRVQVTALEPSDVASYLTSQCGAVERTLCQKVYELSEGHPLCMVELVRQLKEQSTLDADALEIPTAVSDLLCQPLAGLSEEARDVLIDAAVLGREFSLALLAAVRKCCPSALLDVLDSACAADVVGAVADSGMEFRFKHGLLRAALYNRLTPAERRARHARVLETLEQRRSLGELPCAELAYHARAVLPYGDLRKAVEYFEQAATVAQQARAFSDAIRYLRDALEVLDLIEDAAPQQRFRLLFRHTLLVHAQSRHGSQPVQRTSDSDAGVPASSNLPGGWLRIH